MYKQLCIQPARMYVCYGHEIIRVEFPTGNIDICQYAFELIVFFTNKALFSL